MVCMLGQIGSSFWVQNHGGGHDFSVTAQVHNKNIFAEIAITTVQVLGENWHSSVAWITQIVSDSGVENFDTPDGPVVIFRRNVTSITFRMQVYRCRTKARWIINVWS